MIREFFPYYQIKEKPRKKGIFYGFNLVLKTGALVNLINNKNLKNKKDKKRNNDEWGIPYLKAFLVVRTKPFIAVTPRGG